jgi:hypothetical protein
MITIDLTDLQELLDRLDPPHGEVCAVPGCVHDNGRIWEDSHDVVAGVRAA